MYIYLVQHSHFLHNTYQAFVLRAYNEANARQIARTSDQPEGHAHWEDATVEVVGWSAVAQEEKVLLGSYNAG